MLDASKYAQHFPDERHLGRNAGCETGRLPADRSASLPVGGSRPPRTRVCRNSANATGRADQPSGITARPPVDQTDWAGTKHQPASRIAKLPNASTSSTSPGRSSVVEAYSSISAGPVMRLPASSDGRQNTGVGRKCPPKKTLRLPPAAAAGGALRPRVILRCGGLRIRPVTVERRLTISARSAGADVP